MGRDIMTMENVGPKARPVENHFTMEFPLNSHIRQLSLRVLDAIVELFKRVEQHRDRPY
jgi:hypothetical protein